MHASKLPSTSVMNQAASKINRERRQTCCIPQDLSPSASDDPYTRLLAATVLPRLSTAVTNAWEPARAGAAVAIPGGLGAPAAAHSAAPHPGHPCLPQGGLPCYPATSYLGNMGMEGPCFVVGNHRLLVSSVSRHPLAGPQVRVLLHDAHLGA